MTYVYCWDTQQKKNLTTEYDSLLYWESHERASEWISQWYADAAKLIGTRFILKNFNTEQYASTARVNLQEKYWTPLIWQDEPWYQELYEDHNAYGHLDTLNDPMKIRYYENEKDGVRGRISETTPGRYLKKFYGEKLSEKEIQQLVDRHRAAYADTPVLGWATTPEEIVKVYSMPAGFSSCMQYPADHWKKTNGNHPTYVYGAGDLSIAYISQGERLLARALVWKEQNRVGRVYGDRALLRKALSKEGIVTESNSHDFDWMTGARLLYKPLKPVEGMYSEDEATTDEIVLLPYLDGAANQANPHPTDPNYLIIHNPFDGTDTNPDEVEDWDSVNLIQGKFAADHQEGYFYARPRCSCCGQYAPYSGYDVVLKRPVAPIAYEAGTSVDTMSIPGQTSDICHNCMKKKARYCHMSGKYFSKDLKWGKYFSGDSSYDGEYEYCEEYFSNYVFTSSVSNKTYSKYLMVALADGRLLTRKEAVKLTIGPPTMNWGEIWNTDTQTLVGNRFVDQDAIRIAELGDLFNI